MAILKIARMGHPILAQKAQAVADPMAPEIRRLVRDPDERRARGASGRELYETSFDWPVIAATILRTYS